MNTGDYAYWVEERVRLGTGGCPSTKVQIWKGGRVITAGAMFAIVADNGDIVFKRPDELSETPQRNNKC